MKHLAYIITWCSFGSLVLLLSHCLYYKLVGCIWYLILPYAALPIWCTECRWAILWWCCILLTWLGLWIKFIFEECEVADELWELSPLCWVIGSLRWELNTPFLLLNLSEHIRVLRDLIFNKLFDFIDLWWVDINLWMCRGGRGLHDDWFLRNWHPPPVVVEVKGSDVVGAHIERFSLTLHWTRGLRLQWLTRTTVTQRLRGTVLTLQHVLYILIVHFLWLWRLTIVLLFEYCILHAIK